MITAIHTEEVGINGLVCGTVGSGVEQLLVPVDGMCQCHQSTPVIEKQDKYGIIRTNQNLFMDGGVIIRLK